MQNLIRFIRMYHFLLLFLLFQTISATLIINNNSYQNYKMLKLTQKHTGYIFSTSQNIKDYFYLKETNKYLAEENAKLLSLINSSHTKRLKESKKSFSYSPAKIINNTTKKRNNYITLNKGRVHGIKEGMGVITLNGVVGIVHSVSEKFSLVMSILNKESSISIRLNKQNNSGSLKWKGFDYTIINAENIPNHVNIKIHDTISTNGYSTIFPEGINIGTIKSFNKNSEKGHYDIQVKLFEDFNKLTNVYIMKAMDAFEQLKIENLKNE